MFRICRQICTYFCYLVSFHLAGADSLTVIYPQVPSPYNEVFDEIINGIEQQYPQKIQLKALSKDDSPEAVSQWLIQNNVNMLIALGKSGYTVAKMLPHNDPVINNPVVIGALPIRPNGISGISLLADPKVLFTALKQLAPSIKNIHVIYSPGNEWLIDLAQNQAAELGLSLNKIEVQDIKTAVIKYDELLSNIDTKTDAVWLPVDQVTANEQVILPNLLERSWEQNVVLFSSKPAHAKRGALFSMFPDHVELGKQLVNMVMLMNETKHKEGVIPLQEMKLAVNLRTAAHLGFEYKSQQKEKFSLTFPQ
jgi:putative tryptophan/tyrosine transport system substrate-binding protein